jgi:hypothetical protein
MNCLLKHVIEGKIEEEVTGYKEEDVIKNWIYLRERENTVI